MNTRQQLRTATALAVLSLALSSSGVTGESPWGHALSLTGASSQTTLPAAAYFNGDFTIEAWVCLRTLPAAPSALLDCRSPSGDAVTLEVLGNAGGFRLNVANGTTTTSVSAGVPLAAGEWHHVAATLNGATATLYLEGEPVKAQAGFATPRPVVLSNNAIGRLANASSLDGLLDEVRLWNVARSPAQIQSGLTRPLPGSQTGLAACWRFDEERGLVACDAGPSYRHGTLSGGAGWAESSAPWVLPLVTATDSLFACKSIWGAAPGQFAEHPSSLYAHATDYRVGFQELFFVRPIIPYARAAFAGLIGQRLTFGRLHIPIATGSFEPGDRFSAEVRLFTTTETNLETPNLAALAAASDDAAACPVLGTAVFEAGMESLTLVLTESGLEALTDAIHGPQPIVALAFREFLYNDPPPPPEPSDFAVLGVPGAMRLELSAEPKPPRLVTNLDDQGPGSLRSEIASAAPGDTIGFTVSGTIRLTTGPLVLNRPLTIRGPGSSALAISGNQLTRVFDVGADAEIILSDLTIENGQAPNGADFTTTPGGHGGAIDNAGTLDINRCVLRNNRAGNGGSGESAPGGYPGGAGGSGGGVYSLGSLTLTDCQFDDNATGHGGEGGSGAGGGPGGAGGNGGAVCATGPLVVWGCTFTRNLTGDGGAGGHSGKTSGAPGGPGGSGAALFCTARSSLTNNTVSGNRTGRGGNGSDGWSYFGSVANGGNGGAGGAGSGIANQGELALAASTIFGNQTGVGGTGGAGDVGGSPGATGPQGAAGAVIATGTAAATQVCNTILAGNGGSATAPDVSGAINSLGHNLVGNTTGSTGFGVAGDILGMDPMLGPLSDNGGRTWTHALLPGSPAINASDNSASPSTDQRGLPRIACTVADIGAFETQDCPAPVFRTVAMQSPDQLRLEGSGAPQLSYSIQSSGDLATWSPQATVVPDRHGRFSLLLPIDPADSPLFFRLVAPVGSTTTAR